MLINLRNALMTGKRLPYDAEVEYIESTGTQYIDTGFTVEGISLMRVDFQYTSFTAPDGIATQNGVIRQVSGSRYNQFVYCLQNGKFQMYVGTSAYTLFTLTQDLNRHIAEFDIASRRYSIDSTSRSVTLDKNFNNRHIYLFARNNNNTAQHYAPERIFAVRFVEVNGVEHQLVPVRLNNGGYLYDPISDQLIGQGNLVPGPDTN